ncbi:MAG: hypothetical protein AAGA90_03225 [Actinomycetota bacterium]
MLVEVVEVVDVDVLVAAPSDSRPIDAPGAEESPEATTSSWSSAHPPTTSTNETATVIHQGRPDG